VRQKDRDLASRFESSMSVFARERRPLPGISVGANRVSLVEQLVESVRRVKLVAVLQGRELSELRTEPKSELLFDPLKAAIVNMRNGNTEEAFWLVFLFLHFGKHARAGWRYAREVYGRLSGGARWDWASARVDPAGFRAWLDAHQNELKRDGLPRGFGNHRKYESLDGYSANGTGAVVESYIRWVGPPRSHQQLVEEALQKSNGDSKKAFNYLYDSMKVVARFGRTARFDYLTMLGKLGLARIVPPSAYLVNATGPLEGARLLFGVDEKAATLDQWLVDLDAYLSIGMQVLEDALCNWQKSPTKFKPFRG
jgi:Alpha-glutamyl/putrescinyl thymine pyrophosphorylase clade 3